MQNKEKNFVSVVVYVYNSENYIENFMKAIIRVMERYFDHSEIICVNDSSSDNSLDIIKKISTIAEVTSISVVNMSYFHGVEAAMNAGVDMAIGDFVFEFDRAYLDFDVETIMDVYHRSLEGFDIVSACPDHKTAFTSRLFYGIFNRSTSLTYKMNTESFRILSRRVINRVNSMSKSIPYRKALYANSGLKSDSIIYPVKQKINHPYDVKQRQYRTNLAVESLILFTNLGYRFSLLMTITMMIISIFMLIYSVVTYVSFHPVAGWTTTILFLSVAFLGLFGILTIVIRYLQSLIDLVFKKKQYSFESVEKLTK
ncbi:MAG: glycosyltransferase [Ruminococcus flavefaciens]|nr:glycosyltransferase [Ruminococcus flavefaciens]